MDPVQLLAEQRSTSRPSSPEVESLEAQVGQLQSRLMYMEEEKARLVAAAKGKNEQVQVLNAASMFVIGNPTCCTGYEDHAQCETNHQKHQSHLGCLFVDYKFEDMQLTCLTNAQGLICHGV